MNAGPLLAWMQKLSVIKPVSLLIPRRHGSTLAPKSDSKAFDYCVNLVRRRSYEQYLATLLLPPEICRVGFAVRAFNVEISSVRDQISEIRTGIGRMVFWRELISTIYDQRNRSKPNHPVGKELNAAILQHNLSKELFERLIDARDLFVDDNVRPPFFSMQDVDVYSEKAFSSIYYLLLESLATKEATEVKGHARHSANQLGKAEGIITVLRGVPHNASRLRKVYLPVSALTDYQVSSESIIRNTFDKDQMKNLVESMASIADEHLSNARFRSKYLSKKEKLVLLPAVTADRWFSRLHRTRCDLFHSQLNERDHTLPISLYWNKLKRSY